MISFKVFIKLLLLRLRWVHNSDSSKGKALFNCGTHFLPIFQLTSIIPLPFPLVYFINFNHYRYCHFFFLRPCRATCLFVKPGLMLASANAAPINQDQAHIFVASWSNSTNICLYNLLKTAKGKISSEYISLSIESNHTKWKDCISWVCCYIYSHFYFDVLIITFCFEAGKTYCYGAQTFDPETLCSGLSFVKHRIRVKSCDWVEGYIYRFRVRISVRQCFVRG